MAELKEVKLEKIDPNPFRDGNGGDPPATWDSVEKEYGLDELKINELMQNFHTTSFWAGVHARPQGSRYQLCFGHHRVQAAQRAGLKSIPLLVGDYTDDHMLQMMVQENMSDFSHDFYNGVVMAVEAVVKAYGAGKIELEKPRVEKASHGGYRKLYYAPSFVLADIEEDRQAGYTALSVAKYLGWVSAAPKEKNAEGLQAANRVLIAISALELIEKKGLKRAEIRNRTITQVQQIISLQRVKMKQAEEELEREKERLRAVAAAAQKANDPNKLKAAEKKLTEFEAEAPKAVVKAGREVVTMLNQYFKDGDDFKTGLEKAAAAVKVEQAVETKKRAQPEQTRTLKELDAESAKLVEYERAILKLNAIMGEALEQVAVLRDSLKGVSTKWKPLMKTVEGRNLFQVRKKQLLEQLNTVIDVSKRLKQDLGNV